MTPHSPSRRMAVITGASSGLGGHIAGAFAAAGFDLLLCGREAARLNGTRDVLAAAHPVHCLVLQGDLGTAAGTEAFSEALRRHRADIVINNAAINPELVQKRRLSTLLEVADVVHTNTSASISVAMTAFEHLAARGGGIIVNINSVAGLRGSGHEPIYAASKFGLRGFSESVKETWLAQGVRMTDVYVGAIGTGMSADRHDAAELIDPDELAALIVRLCETRSLHTREINLQKTVPAARRPRRVVFANGVFDLLHPGHIALLEFARSLGDRLVVGLNSDRSVRELKGPGRPIRDQNARKAVLEALRFVDQVVIFDELRTTEVVRKVKPDIVVKGQEYTPDAVRAADRIPDDIEIVTCPILLDAQGMKFSTTATIENMPTGR